MAIGVIVLLGAGMFFFQVEYDDMDELTDVAQLEQESASADPYAWAKARQEPVSIPSTAVAETPVAAQPVAAAVQPAAPQSSQHPGWLWDSESNSWVPDPNFTPEQ